jgi:hypothetical protein
MTTKQFTLRIPQDLHAAFKAKAAMTRKSMGEILENFIRRFTEDETEEILTDTGFSKKLDESIAQADRGDLISFESLKVRPGLNQ